MAKLFSVKRLSSQVRAHFPKARTVSDATKPVEIHVNAWDTKKAQPHDPSACAMALACKREQELDGAWIGISIAYLLKGTHLTRYLTPQSVAREIVTFDRHRDFATGTYRLSRIPPSIAKHLGTHARPDSKKTGQTRPRSTHVLKAPSDDWHSETPPRAEGAIMSISKTLIPAETKILLATQMQAVADTHGNLSDTARQLSRAWLVRSDTIQTNWRRWLKEHHA